MSKLIGTDFAERCRQVGEQLEADNEQRLNRQAQASHEYEGNHVYYLVVSPLGEDVMVSSIEDFPLLGRLRAAGRNYDVACTNLRLLYAHRLTKFKLLPDLDTARAYAAKCIFRVSQ
jgi:hypothetical protein